jgi:hypothetical protein
MSAHSSEENLNLPELEVYDLGVDFSQPTKLSMKIKDHLRRYLTVRTRAARTIIGRDKPPLVEPSWVPGGPRLCQMSRKWQFARRSLAG